MLMFDSLIYSTLHIYIEDVIWVLMWQPSIQVIHLRFYNTLNWSSVSFGFIRLVCEDSWQSLTFNNQIHHINYIPANFSKCPWGFYVKNGSYSPSNLQGGLQIYSYVFLLVSWCFYKLIAIVKLIVSLK